MSTQTRNPAAQSVQANHGSTPSLHQRMSSVRRAHLRSALLRLRTPASPNVVPSQPRYNPDQLSAGMVPFEPVNVSAWALEGRLVVQFFSDIPTYQFVTAQGRVMTICLGTDDQAQLQAAFVAAQSS
ncbi:hypothetical protein PG990_001617 [Apiospora arundinis]|uniref:Uncharacterized protein n=1 Tax=Apiospora arundinis TaxID=335852 RepID=A0ABR2HS17_9PEZI